MTTEELEQQVHASIHAVARKYGWRPDLLILHYKLNEVALGSRRFFVITTDKQSDIFMGLKVIISSDLPEDPGYIVAVSAEQVAGV